MNILYISLSLPPFAESQSIRSAYLIEHLAKCGHKVTLLTGTVPEHATDESLLRLIPASVRWLRTQCSSFDKTIATFCHSKLGSALAYAYSNLFLRIKVPDVRRDWRQVAVEMASTNFRREDFDLIVSAHGAPTAHLVGFDIAKKWRIPWVMEMGDPWGLLPLSGRDFTYLRWKSRKIESIILPHAAGVVVCTDETRKLYLSSYGPKLPPTVVIPFGFREDDFLPPAELLPHTSDVVSLVYVGVAYRHTRSLIPLLESLSTLRSKRRRFSLKVQGPHSKVFENKSSRLRLENVTFSGRISYAHTLAALKDASVVIVIGNPSPLQIPGKLFHAIASGKPILYIANLPPTQDPGVRLLSQFEGVVIAENTKQNLHNALSIIDNNLEGLTKLSRERAATEAARKLNSQNLGQSFENFLTHITSARTDR